MLPPPISEPLSTMSYALARTLPGSVSSSGRSSSSGAVNGWCIADQRFSSLSHSSIGKSVTQSRWYRDGSIIPSFSPRWSRSRPRDAQTTSNWSATNRSRSPGFASARSRIAASCSSLKNFVSGDVSPSSVTLNHARPAAPPIFATSSSAAISDRLDSASPGAVIPRMKPPFAATSANTRNSVCESRSV